ncbi:Uncharacterized protein DAT39_002693, partial [Clarias magur]
MDGVFGLCIGCSVQPAFTLHSLFWEASALERPGFSSRCYSMLKKMDSPLIKDNLAHIVAWNGTDSGRIRLYR